MKQGTAGERLRSLWNRYKFVLLVAAVGALLLAWPTGGGEAERPQTLPEETADASQEALRELETRMEEILGAMEGVGTLRLMLTAESSEERQLAVDTELSYSGATAAPDDYTRRSQTVVVSGGDGDETVAVKRVSPVYRGALVVCQGAGSAEVRLAVTQAVASLTGLPSDRIAVVKCQ